MSEQKSLGELSEDEDSENASTSSFLWKNIPEDWNLVKGTHVYSVNPSYSAEGEVSYIGMGELSEELPYPNLNGTREVDDNSGKLFKENDVIFPRITPCTENGKRAIITELPTEVGIGSTEFIVLSSDKEKMLPWYLFYLVNSYTVRDYAISRMRGSTGRQRVPYSVFRNELDVPLPPKSEQEKIASVLYNVDQAIQKTEEIIEQTQRVKKGLMQDLFTEGDASKMERRDIRIGPKEHKVPEAWQVKELGDLIEIQSGNSFKSKNYVDEGIPLIRISNIQKGYLDLEDLEHLPEEHKEENNSYLLEKDDIVLVMTRPIIGSGIKASRIDDDEYLLNQRMVKIESEDESKLLNNFLYHYLFSEVFIHQVKISVRATHQPNLSKNDLKSFKIPLPPIDKQKEILNSLNSVNNRISHNKKLKKELESVKKGLMQDLLTGEVRTHDKDIEVLEEVKA